MSGQLIDKIISFTCQFLNHVAEKWETTLPHDSLPPAFGNARKWVALVQQILGGIQDQWRANRLNRDDTAILEALESTKAAAQNLSAIFRAIENAAETDRNGRYEEFLRTPNATGIEVALFQLLQGPHELIDECIIDATVDQAHEVTEAIKELKLLQPSTPMSQTAAVAHYGRGDLFSNPGSGRQNVNMRNGTQYNSERMNLAGRSNS